MHWLRWRSAGMSNRPTRSSYPWIAQPARGRPWSRPSTGRRSSWQGRALGVAGLFRCVGDSACSNRPMWRLTTLILPSLSDSSRRNVLSSNRRPTSRLFMSNRKSEYRCRLVLRSQPGDAGDATLRVLVHFLASGRRCRVHLPFLETATVPRNADVVITADLGRKAGNLTQTGVVGEAFSNSATPRHPRPCVARARLRSSW